MSATWEIRQGDALQRLREMPDESVHACVTSPPYFGLRDYGSDGQIGLEPSPDEFVAALVAVFAEVRRVLRSDGTLWLNIGDSYAAGKAGRTDHGTGSPASKLGPNRDGLPNGASPGPVVLRSAPPGLKAKDLIGVPWLLAFALRADGWYLRSDIIWAKPNPMPESVTDRPTSAHEHLFLLAKSPRYFYDADAIREADAYTGHPRNRIIPPEPSGGLLPEHRGLRLEAGRNGLGRNKRNVWEIATQPYAAAHFATFPPKLVEPCILAGSAERACGECGAPWERVVERELRDTEGWGKASKDHHAGVQGSDAITRNGQGRAGDPIVRMLGFEPSCAHDDDTGSSVILDPFAGAGTIGIVALRHGRSFIGIELNPAYCALARDRIRDDAPLLNTHAEVAA